MVTALGDTLRRGAELTSRECIVVNRVADRPMVKDCRQDC